MGNECSVVGAGFKPSGGFPLNLWPDFWPFSDNKDSRIVLGVKEVWKSISQRACECADGIKQYKQGVVTRFEKYACKMRFGQVAMLVAGVAAVSWASSLGFLPLSLNYSGLLAIKVALISLCISTSIEKLHHIPEPKEMMEASLTMSPFIGCVAVPSLEELIIRKWLYSLMRYGLTVAGMHSPLVCTVASLGASSVFGAAHISNTDDRTGKILICAATFCISQALLFPAYFSGGLLASIFAHAVYNTSLFVAERASFIVCDDKEIEDFLVETDLPSACQG